MVGTELMAPAEDDGRWPGTYDPGAGFRDEPGRIEPATEKPPPPVRDPTCWCDLNLSSVPGGSEKPWPSWRVMIKMPGFSGGDGGAEAGAVVASGRTVGSEAITGSVQLTYLGGILGFDERSTAGGRGWGRARRAGYCVSSGGDGGGGGRAIE